MPANDDHHHHQLEHEYEGKIKLNKSSSRCVLVKEFEVIRTSGADEWRTFEVYPDDMECLTFHISDSGDVLVELIACDFNIDRRGRKESYKNIRFPLSALKGFIEEAEQIASVTFDDKDCENEEKG